MATNPQDPQATLCYIQALTENRLREFEHHIFPLVRVGELLDILYKINTACKAALQHPLLLNEVRSLRKALEIYGWHKQECSYRTTISNPCDCGYSKSLNNTQEAGDEH